MDTNGKRYTKAGTDIEQVKKQNAKAGGGMMPSFGTDPQKVKEEIAAEAGPFAFGKQSSMSAEPSLGKTVAGTDIAEVKRQNSKSQNKS